MLLHLIEIENDGKQGEKEGRPPPYSWRLFPHGPRRGAAEAPDLSQIISLERPGRANPGPCSFRGGLDHGPGCACGSRCLSPLSIVRCIEEHTRETGVFKGRELAPVLAKCYCTYSAELRRVLETLGIRGKAAERVLTPYEIVAAERAERAQDGRSEAGEGMEP